MRNPKNISFRYFVYRMMRMRLEKLILSDADTRLEGKRPTSYGFCFSTLDCNIEEFPEIYSKKPKYVLGAYWYHPQERKLRLDIIDNVIKETRMNMSRRQVMTSYLMGFVYPLEVLYALS